MAAYSRQSDDKHHEFRFTIIAGSLKGKTITAPDLGVTRPPLTRLRRAIFDFLQPYLESARYLDLFSGTGSYLFEAVSRGAETATGVEIERRLADAINQQAAKLQVDDRLLCLCDDVFNAIPRFARQRKIFHIIMVAPPQYVGLIDQTLALLQSHNILARDGMIVCQHDTSETARINYAGFETAQRRKYGNTTFTILRSHQ
jgi:16S rRNA (guanine(966)-N(2))-methyltransferase RsmD